MPEEKESSDFYFIEFKDNMELKEIILGPHCDIEVTEVAKHLCSYEHEVEIIKSRTAHKEY